MTAPTPSMIGRSRLLMVLAVLAGLLGGFIQSAPAAASPEPSTSAAPEADATALPDVPLTETPEDPPVLAPSPDEPEADPVAPGEAPTEPEPEPVKRPSKRLAPADGPAPMASAASDLSADGQDLTSDGVPDLLARDSDGRLWTYPGIATGGFRTRIASGSGWTAMDQVHIVGNWNGAGGNDVIARKPSTGQLFLYPGNGSAGFGTAVAIGVSWNGMRELEPVGDLTGDGLPDLTGLHATDGKVYLYPGNGSGGFRTGSVLGVGFDSYAALTGTGDWNGDNAADLIARRSDGKLYAFHGANNSTLRNGGEIGNGWGTFTALIGGADRSGDGNADLLARRSDGKLMLYPGNGVGGFLAPTQVGSGWSAMVLNEPVPASPPPPELPRPTIVVPTDGTTISGTDPIQFAGTGAPATPLTLSDNAGSATTTTDAQGNWSLELERAPGTYTVSVRHTEGSTEGPAHTISYIVADPPPAEPEGMTEVPVPHIIGVSDAVGTVEPYPVPTVTPMVHVTSVDEGRDAYLSGEDLSGGAPGAERPVLTFEVEIWTEENAALLDSLEVATERPDVGYPTLSYGEQAVAEGLLSDGVAFKVRARTVWQAAPEYVEPISAWTDWQSYVVKLPPPTPLNMAPADGSQVTDSRPELHAQVSATPNQVTGTFEILDANGWRVEMGTSQPTGDGQLRWRPVEPLTSGTYSWHVAASNPSGASAWSELTSFTVAVPPPPPQGVSAEGLARSAKVSWQQPPTGHDVNGYVIRALPDGPTVTVPGWSLYAYVGDLAGDRDWSFSVRAQNQHGLSDESVTTPVFVGMAPPAAPQGLSGTAMTSGASLSWQPPIDDGGRAVTGYLVRYYNFYGQRLVTEIETTGTSATVTGLTPGTLYRFDIMAINSIDTGTLALSYVTPFTYPSAPTEVIVRSADGALDVHWEAPEANGFDWISSYTVYLSPSDRRLTVARFESYDGVRIDGLDNDTAYTVTVVATNQAGDGPSSAPVGPINPVSSSQDTDADGLPDVMEFRAGSNHLVADTDGDGLSDRYEALELAGLSSPTQADTDSDGVTDFDADVDGDGLRNAQEATLGTDPASADTDGDGAADGAEVSAQSDPLSADSDGDTVLDGVEAETGIDPLDADSDDDGVPDADDAAERTGSFEYGESEETETDPVTVTVKARGRPAALHDLRVDSSGVATVPSALTPTALVTVPEGENGEAPAVTLDELTLPLLTQHLPEEVGVLSSGASGGWSLAENQVVITLGEGSVVVKSAEVGVRYAVVDLADWRARLRGCDLVRSGEGARLDVELIFDETQSVGVADPSGERFDAARAVLNTLSPGDAVDVRAFGWVWLSAGFGGTMQGEPDLQLPGPDGLVSVTTALGIVDKLESRGSDWSWLGDYGWDPYEAFVPDGFLTYEEEDPRTEEQKQCRQKVIILATDAKGEPPAEDEGQYFEGYTPFTQRTEPPVHVLDVGSGGESAQWVIDVAARTDGTYSHVPTLDIVPAPDWGRGATLPEQTPREGLGQDLDEDGLDDWIEREGVDVAIASVDGPLYERVRTDPTLADSDGDGLLDGEEMGRQFTAAELGSWSADQPITVFHTVSDALSSDGDRDGLLDTEELELGYDPLDWDMDTDMVSDGEETEWGTSPTRGDTDSDQRNDWIEIENADQGLNPTEFNETVSETKFLEDAATGFICGEIAGCQIYSIGWLVGNIASGVLIFGDVRDLIALGSQGEEFEAAMSGVGLVPYLGDAAKATSKIIKILPHLKKADQATAVEMTKRFTDDASAFVDALRQIDPNLVDNLRGLGVGDDALRRLLANNSLEHLRRIVSSPNRIDFDYPPGLRPGWLPGGRFNGHVGEEFTQRILGLPDSALKKVCRKVRGTCRYVDVVEVDGLTTRLHESKIGYVNGSRAEQQILSDIELAAQANTQAAWHFFGSATTGRIGPSQAILKKLEDAGIPFYIHFPE